MHIEGLTKRQVEMLDTLWSLDSLDDVEIYVNTLNKNEKKTALTLVEMLSIACVDEEIEKLKSYPTAKKVLSNIFGKQ
jgi:hypothetical protein